MKSLLDEHYGNYYSLKFMYFTVFTVLQYYVMYFTVQKPFL